MNQLSTDLVVVLITFITLCTVTFIKAEKRKKVLSRTFSDWILDTISLLSQGLLIPILQVVVVSYSLKSLFGTPFTVDIGPLGSFALNFLLIDYMYYLNHRWLHKKMWKLHYVHHTAKHLDIFITSRNSLITPLFIVYIWANGFFIWILKDAYAFMLAIAFSSALDLWRHSGIKTNHYIAKWIGVFLILPEDHQWHHSRDVYHVNFGANLNIWDRLHKTFYRPNIPVDHLGIDDNESLKNKMFLPWRIKT